MSYVQPDTTEHVWTTDTATVVYRRTTTHEAITVAPTGPAPGGAIIITDDVLNAIQAARSYRISSGGVIDTAIVEDEPAPAPARAERETWEWDPDRAAYGRPN